MNSRSRSTVNWRIQRRIAARRDDRIEDRQNLLGVLNPHIANLDHHKNATGD